MNRVDILIDAGRSAVAKFHELRLKYWNRDIDVICCFEGGDDQEFYLAHVRRDLGLHGSRVDVVNCAGKKTVLSMLRWSTEKAWNLARLGFFVDRDFDDFLQNGAESPQLYISDHYSIESHVVDDDYFANVWQDLFRLSVTDDRYAAWKSLYYSGAETFARLLKSVTHLALAAKLSGGSVDFERVRLNDLASLSPEGHVLRRTGHVSFSYADVVLGSQLSRESLRSARKAVASSDYRKWLRGKFLLWYSTTFFARMKSVLGARGQLNRAVVRFHFSVNTAAFCLCSRATPPRSLIDFLRLWAARIVAEGLVPRGGPG
ncbi:hypothetical protein ACVWWJ_004460 [Luteibacter sp. HA06]